MPRFRPSILVGLLILASGGLVLRKLRVSVPPEETIGGDSTNTVTLSDQDSSNSSLIRYPRSAIPQGRWLLDSTPLLQIGGSGQGSTELFAGIVGVARLSDGTIVVGDASSSEIRYFSREGRYLGAAGRSGEGPGEFRGLFSIAQAGDTICAGDMAGRVSLFAPGRTLVRTIMPPTSGRRGLALLIGCFENGAPVFTQTFPYNQAAKSGAVAILGNIFTLQQAHVHLLLDSIEMTSFVGTPNGPQPEAFSSGVIWAISGLTLCTVHTLRYRISCMNETGRVLYRVDWDLPPEPMTPAIQASFMRAIVAKRNTNEIASGPSRRLEPLFPANLPLVAQLLIADGGELWVRDYSIDDAILATGRGLAPPNPTTWTVFSSRGQMLGSVLLPKRFRPFRVGNDYVLGVLRDDDDVELVTMYRLTLVGAK